MGHMYKFFGYSISYKCWTLHPHGYLVTTYLYFLIPSPLHPFPDNRLPSGNPQNALHIHDSVSVLLCFISFLDLIVDTHVFITILLFIVLIFFFLNKSLCCHPSWLGRFMVFVQTEKYSWSRWYVWHAFIHGWTSHACCKLHVYLHVSCHGPCSPAWHSSWHLSPCVSLIITTPRRECLPV